MKRNLESRVEAMVPVEDPRLQKELRAILDLQLDDQRRRLGHAVRRQLRAARWRRRTGRAGARSSCSPSARPSAPRRRCGCASASPRGSPAAAAADRGAQQTLQDARQDAPSGRCSRRARKCAYLLSTGSASAPTRRKSASNAPRTEGFGIVRGELQLDLVTDVAGSVLRAIELEGHGMSFVTRGELGSHAGALDCESCRDTGAAPDRWPRAHPPGVPTFRLPPPRAPGPRAAAAPGRGSAAPRRPARARARTRAPPDRRATGRPGCESAP